MIVFTCTTAAVLLPSGASASSHELPQQRLLDRACNLASVHIRKVMDEAATKQVLTVRTQVRVLRPGKLTADIAFNPSGTTLSVAADRSGAGTVAYGCGAVSAGGPGNPGSAGSEMGVGIPKSHLVAVLRERFKAPGRYILTFTLNQNGQRILGRLGEEQRAYRKRHPHGKHLPTITWGVGIRYVSTG